MKDACENSQNDQHILSTVTVGTLSTQHNKCRMTKETTDKPTTMMTEQGQNGLKPTADDYNIQNEAGRVAHSCNVHTTAGM
jgi:hypothetical protein